MLDVAALRAHFPSLATGAAHFDGPGGTQTPDLVARAVQDALVGPLSNRGQDSVAERNADAAVVTCRAALGDFLNADPSGIIFGRSMTQITFDLSRAMAKGWGPGDEVVVSRLDHDSNVRPWVLAAEAAGASVRWADFDPATGELPPGVFDDLLNERTRLVAVTAASNLIGTMPDLPAIAERAHAVGAWLYVDGVHYAAHNLIDLPALGADFFGCSPYKFLGPHCAAVAGRPELLEQLHPDKLRPSTNAVPERFEFGTLPYELMAGTTAAIDFLAGLGERFGGLSPEGDRRSRLAASLELVEQREAELRTRIEGELTQFPGVTVYSRAARRTPTLLVRFDGVDPHELYRFLGARGVNLPAGNFYAYEASVHLGLGEQGGSRIGVAPYTSDQDVDRLVEGLRAWFAG
ncbi:MAG: cysteine desulfurase-like protein [Micropruina sp.]